MTRSVGIDLSTKATGLVILDAAPPKPVARPIPVVVKCFQPKGLFGIARNIWLCEQVMTVIEAYSPDTIVVEGYSLNVKNAASIIPLVELGGLLRFCLKIDERSWLDPRATQLKKFATGTGNAKKDQVMLAVFKNWGFEAPNSDVADAYGLAAMGLAYRGGLSGLTQVQNGVIGEMKLTSN